jgi:hypothetical protein
VNRVPDQTRLNLRRRIGAALSLLYLAVVAVVPLAHARAERFSGPPQAESHLHAPGHDCPPPHDEQHCPTCQFAGLKNLPPHSSPSGHGSARVDLTGIVRELTRPAQHPVRTPGSRAPPIA